MQLGLGEVRVLLGHDYGVPVLAQLEHLLVRVYVLALLQTDPLLLLFGQVQVRTAEKAVDEAVEDVPGKNKVIMMLKLKRKILKTIPFLP